MKWLKWMIYDIRTRRFRWIKFLWLYVSDRRFRIMLKDTLQYAFTAAFAMRGPGASDAYLFYKMYGCGLEAGHSDFWEREEEMTAWAKQHGMLFI